MRSIWAGSLSVMLGLIGTTTQGGEPAWRPAAAGNGVTLGAPAASLDRPVPRGSPPPAIVDSGVRPVAANAAETAAPPTVVRAQSFDPGGGPPPVPPPPPPVPTPPGSEPYNCGVVGGGPGPTCGLFNFGACCLDRGWFRSDHCFDQFVSPITNPFLFEDPRSLTEIRSIFIYQSAPLGNPTFRGGNLEWSGVQARVAITDRLSFVMNKLGFVRLEPNNPGGEFEKETGFSEVWLGPKFTFLRCENTGTLGAVGLTFQIPAGPAKVFQNTGDLSLTPYVSMGQNFWRTSWGSVNALGTVGYTFRTDNQRSEYFFLSWHLDYDIANLHKIYPMIEMNWFSYTTSGKVRNTGFEGADLVNFGATGVAGNNILTIATGLRYKFTEWLQTGIAAEWPISSRKDLMDFRLTADLIFRY